MRKIDSELPVRPDRIAVMGILNITPDSFSDGGQWATVDDAVAHGRRMHHLGADLIDVGGESTRPGAERVPVAEELRRVVPVVTALAADGIAVSIDTTRARVAEACLHAGAAIVNDVSGGAEDPGMSRLVAEAGCPWVLMHRRGTSRTMASLAGYEDVVHDVAVELSRRVDDAIGACVRPEQIVLDPGLGFAKRPDDNWRLISHLESLAGLGFPLLVGASRKSFLGRLLADGTGHQRPVRDREHATSAITLYAALAGAWAVRVHEVRPSVDAALAAAAIERARDDGRRPLDQRPAGRSVVDAR
jgi:dihydropteroate synthase